MDFGTSERWLRGRVPPVGRPVDSPEVLERFDSALDLVNILARQITAAAGHSLELDELVSYGREGLLLAARRFDSTRGVPFRAYAYYRVHGAIIDGIRTMAPLPRRLHERFKALEAGALCSEGAAEDAFGTPAQSRTSAEAEAALGEHLANMATAMSLGLIGKRVRGDGGEPTTEDRAPTPEEAVGRVELLSFVARELESLPYQEAELVRRHYLEGDRFDRVAEDLGLSKSWASRLHTRAIARLTERFRAISDVEAPP